MNIKGNRYELCIILPADLGKGETNDVLDEVRSLLSENSCKIESEDMWGIRNFAYPINKKDKGNYVIFYFHADVPSKISVVNRSLNLNKQVIRFLLIKIPAFYNPPKADSLYESTEKLMKKLVSMKEEESSKLQAELEKITVRKKDSDSL